MNPGMMIKENLTPDQMSFYSPGVASPSSHVRSNRFNIPIIGNLFVKNSATIWI